MGEICGWRGFEVFIKVPLIIIDNVNKAKFLGEIVHQHLNSKDYITMIS